MSQRSPYAKAATTLACLVSTLLVPASARAAPAPAQETPQQPRTARSGLGGDSDGKKSETPAPKPKKQVEYLTAWPKPADKDAVLLDIERLCKSRTPEMGVQAREALETTGAPAVPFLLDRLGKERDETASKRLREVLVADTNAAHTRLLAKEFDSRFQATRTFTLWRAAAFPDPEIRAPAEAAWKRIDKQGAKADPEERYAAALCAASAGSVAGIEILQEAALKTWERRGVELRAALEGVRGPDATKIVLGRLKDADQKQKVAILRLLAGCGDRSSLAVVKHLLEDDDNQIRVAAINACRGIVEGTLPQEQLPVFEAIELAKKWKEKI
jgi:hypothetical protein